MQHRTTMHHRNIMQHRTDDMQHRTTTPPRAPRVLATLETILTNVFYAVCFGVVLYVIGWHFWEAMYDPCAFQWHEGC